LPSVVAPPALYSHISHPCSAANVHVAQIWRFGGWRAAKVEPRRWHDPRHIMGSKGSTERCQFARAHTARRSAQLLDRASVLALRAHHLARATVKIRL